MLKPILADCHEPNSHPASSPVNSTEPDSVTPLLDLTSSLVLSTVEMEQMSNQLTQPSLTNSFTNAAFQPDSTFQAQTQGQPVQARNNNPSLNSSPAMAMSNPGASQFTFNVNVQSQSQPQTQTQTQTHTQTQSQANEQDETEPKGGPTATAPFLRDFSLVAEAAKRAQMAVVMRDLEGISL